MAKDLAATVPAAVANRASIPARGLAMIEAVAFAALLAAALFLTSLRKGRPRRQVLSDIVIGCTSLSDLTIERLVVDIAPIVQQLAVYTEVTLLKPAGPILAVVLGGGELEMEAQVLNRDIGFVRPGLEMTVKLEAFPFTRYGTLPGELGTRRICSW